MGLLIAHFTKKKFKSIQDLNKHLVPQYSKIYNLKYNLENSITIYKEIFNFKNDCLESENISYSEENKHSGGNSGHNINFLICHPSVHRYIMLGNGLLT